MRYRSGDNTFDERAFFLVSCGCELIAMKKSTLMHIANRETLEKLQRLEKTYASDEDLYSAFNEQKRWKLYRERLVDNIKKWRKPDAKRSETM